MNDQNRIIEINGVKLEVDLRTAVRVDTLRIGDRVKCLIKNYNDFSVYPGVVVGFDPFEKLPTICVAYISHQYNKAELKIVAFNEQTKDIEIVPDNNPTSLELNKDTTLQKFDREIEKKVAELEEIQAQRDFFLKNFGVYFEGTTKEM